MPVLDRPMDPSNSGLWRGHQNSVPPKLIWEVGTKIPGMTRVPAYLWTSLWHSSDPSHW